MNKTQLERIRICQHFALNFRSKYVAAAQTRISNSFRRFLEDADNYYVPLLQREEFVMTFHAKMAIARMLIASQISEETAHLESLFASRVAQSDTLRLYAVRLKEENREILKMNFNDTMLHLLRSWQMKAIAVVLYEMLEMDYGAAEAEAVAAKAEKGAGKDALLCEESNDAKGDEDDEKVSNKGENADKAEKKKIPLFMRFDYESAICYAVSMHDLFQPLLETSVVRVGDLYTPIIAMLESRKTFADNFSVQNLLDFLVCRFAVVHQVVKDSAKCRDSAFSFSTSSSPSSSSSLAKDDAQKQDENNNVAAKTAQFAKKDTKNRQETDQEKAEKKNNFSLSAIAMVRKHGTAMELWTRNFAMRHKYVRMLETLVQLHVACERHQQVTDESFSHEMRMRALGARVNMAPSKQAMRDFVARFTEFIRAETDDYYSKIGFDLSVNSDVEEAVNLLNNLMTTYEIIYPLWRQGRVYLPALTTSLNRCMMEKYSAAVKNKEAFDILMTAKNALESGKGNKEEGSEKRSNEEDKKEGGEQRLNNDQDGIDDTVKDGSRDVEQEQKEKQNRRVAKQIVEERRDDIVANFPENERGLAKRMLDEIVIPLVLSVSSASSSCTK